jgi:hypothetical protein
MDELRWYATGERAGIASGLRRIGHTSEQLEMHEKIIDALDVKILSSLHVSEMPVMLSQRCNLSSKRTEHLHKTPIYIFEADGDNGECHSGRV